MSPDGCAVLRAEDLAPRRRHVLAATPHLDTGSTRLPARLQETETPDWNATST